MTGPRFDPTINLGHIVTAIAFLIPLIGFFYVTNIRLDALEDRLDTYNDTLIQIAKQDVEIRTLNDRVLRLESRQ